MDYSVEELIDHSVVAAVVVCHPSHCFVFVLLHAQLCRVSVRHHVDFILP